MFDWKSVKGWLSAAEGECLARWARTCAEQHPSPVVVELGSYLGRSTALLADTLRHPDAQLWAVDRWAYKRDMDPLYQKYRERTYLPTFVENMVRLGVMPLIQPICALTQDVAPIFKDSSVHMIFHDASHNYEGVARDIEAWLKKLVLGGVWVHHDHNRSGGRAVDDCPSLKMVEKKELIAVFRKIEPPPTQIGAPPVAAVALPGAGKVSRIHPLLRPRHSR